ncbi:MAG: DUF4440 domain-containing protein [Lewinella sp.]|uniref:DUF4440 domain-containing protein n=1 Tax=Lewinella sp. TaxID=2004506 RepID=UPI003D6A6700
MNNLDYPANLLNYTTIHGVKPETISAIKELEIFSQGYVSAFNEQDAASLRKMYNEYAVRIDRDGKEMVGGNQIVSHLMDPGQPKNVNLRLRPTMVIRVQGQSGYVVRGTYEIVGKTIVYDIDIHTIGTYTNTMVKYDGRWQIAKSVLAPLVKTLVHHEVEDFYKWKSGFEAGEASRIEAGEISSEIGTLRDDPNMVYILSEWSSLENFQALMANPEMGKAMQQAGVTGKPTVLILDRQ